MLLFIIMCIMYCVRNTLGVCILQNKSAPELKPRPNGFFRRETFKYDVKMRKGPLNCIILRNVPPEGGPLLKLTVCVYCFPFISAASRQKTRYLKIEVKKKS
jgi:hypothetical protein